MTSTRYRVLQGQSSMLSSLRKSDTGAENNAAILCLDVCLLNRKIHFIDALKESR